MAVFFFSQAARVLPMLLAGRGEEGRQRRGPDGPFAFGGRPAPTQARSANDRYDSRPSTPGRQRQIGHVVHDKVHEVVAGIRFEEEDEDNDNEDDEDSASIDTKTGRTKHKGEDQKKEYRRAD